jgi:transposase
MRSPAELGGRVSQVQIWFDQFRAGGLAALLHRGRGKGPKSLLRPVIAEQMSQKLRRGDWRRGLDAQQWLEKKHGVKVKLVTVYKYLGKCEARLKVPRPSHQKKNPQAVETFKAELAANLTAMGIERKRPVRLWVADEPSGAR